jgi:hypothetical protein
MMGIRTILAGVFRGYFSEDCLNFFSQDFDEEVAGNREIFKAFFVCLMTGAAVGRQLQCTYLTYSHTLWPPHKCCFTTQVDFSVKFETEKRYRKIG